MRQGNILNEATAVSLATFLGEAIRFVILIVARDWPPSLALWVKTQPSCRFSMA